MTVHDRPASSPAARAEALNAVADDLAGELQLQPLLERILQRCTELMGCDAGSISSVDETAGTYRKQADIGVRCQSGRVFPLGEGMTGEVVRRRGPVWFDRYDDVVGGHISAEDRATLTSVIGVPLEWRGRIIGACVVFSRDAGRRFDRADADLLRMFAKHATVALVNANSYEAAEERARLQAASAERGRLLDEVHDLLAQGLVGMLSGLERAEQLAPVELAGQLREAQESARDTVASIRRALLGAGSSPLEGHSLEDVLRSELAWASRARAVDARLVVAGTPVALDRALAQRVLSVAQEAITNIVQHSRAKTVRVGLAYESASLSLLVQDDGQGFAAGQGLREPDEFRTGLGLRRMVELAQGAGGSLSLDSMPGWGTSIRAVFPHQRAVMASDVRVDVLVVAAQPMLRAGLSRLLAWSEPPFSVVGEASTTAEALEAVGRLRPAVAVVAVNEEPLADSLGLIRELVKGEQAPAVIAVCRPGDDQAVVDLLLAGAHGCVETTADGAALARAVAAAARGESIVPHGEVWEGRLSSESHADGLTAREREVRALVQQGLGDRAIAEQLVISVKTVEKHVSAVLRKTGARSRSELIAGSQGRLNR
ncbi:hybrid sensor histidine kinase/response regulator [Kribbella ginsengisoli]|uniref:GAF domain-containing protein n=1 Tax=Kribbella ginsengisoli TaxID=363865 RepID=A0ABP6Z5W3_9ACTN